MAEGQAAIVFLHIAPIFCDLRKIVFLLEMQQTLGYSKRHLGG